MSQQRVLWVLLAHAHCRCLQNVFLINCFYHQEFLLLPRALLGLHLLSLVHLSSGKLHRRGWWRFSYTWQPWPSWVLLSPTWGQILAATAIPCKQVFRPRPRVVTIRSHLVFPLLVFIGCVLPDEMKS